MVFSSKSKNKGSEYAPPYDHGTLMEGGQAEHHVKKEWKNFQDGLHQEMTRPQHKT
jgi:hypothetical protein